MSSRRFMVLACLMTLLACSSGSGGTTSGGEGGTTPGATCAKKTASLSGNVDGTSVEQTYKSSGYAFVVKEFSGYIGTGGKIEILLTATGASSKGSDIASAKLTMPSEGPLPGKVFCANGGVLTSGDAYTFTLTGLQAGDASADAGATTCTGAYVPGSLSGCVAGAN